MGQSTNAPASCRPLDMWWLSGRRCRTRDIPYRTATRRGFSEQEQLVKGPEVADTKVPCPLDNVTREQMLDAVGGCDAISIFRSDWMIVACCGVPLLPETLPESCRQRQSAPHSPAGRRREGRSMRRLLLRVLELVAWQFDSSLSAGEGDPLKESEGGDVHSLVGWVEALNRDNAVGKPEHP